MEQPNEMSYAISVLQWQIANLDILLKNGHLLPNGERELEEKQKSLQAGILKLMK